MKYTKECELYYIVLTGSLKKELSKKYDGFYICDLMKKMKAEYKALILRTPDIGGKENRLAHNLYIGAVFIACYKVSNKRISIEELKQIMVNTLSKCEVIKWFFGKRDPFSEHSKESLATFSTWTQQYEQKYPTNWILHVKYPQPEKGICYQFSRCALHELCKREGCCEIMPILCKIDMIMISFGKAKLIRKTTLIEGASYCDYWLVKK